MMSKKQRVVVAKPSRNGCRTCRIRKVKCDETRPKCQRCVATGRQCDGYSVVISTRHREHAATNRQLVPSFAHRSGTTLPIPISIAPTRLATNEIERLAYEYFLHKTVSALWQVSPGKKWIRLALQLALHEQTVFYAATAVGAVNKAQQHFYHHTLSRPALPTAAGGLGQYCKASMSLRRYMGVAIANGASLEPVLLCCVLFACFEIYHGRGHQALVHLRLGSDLMSWNGESGAARIVSPTRSPPRNSPGIPDELVDAFEKLSAGFEKVPRTFQPPQNLFTLHTMDRITMPPQFASIEIAKEALRNLIDATARYREELVERAMNRMTSTDKSFRDAVQYCIANCLSRTLDVNHDKVLSHRASELKRAHAIWSQLLAGMKPQPQQESSRDLALMKIQWFFSTHVLETSHVTKEEELDRFNNQIIQALDWIEQYLGHETGMPDVSSEQCPLGGTIRPEPQWSFSPEHTILPMLYLAGLKCRLSHVRRRAIQLLRTSYRREGIHYSLALADRAEDVSRLEESRTRQCMGFKTTEHCGIPEAARFADVVVEGLSPIESRMICCRFRHESDGRMELLEYRRLREPFMSDQPVWQVVLDHRCQVEGVDTRNS